ncbi:hypothetical protein NUKP41_23030 [Klebsiella variicola]|nr:hypothetical protein AE36_01259 [Klebsiella variicola]GKK22486.1 hypothetical protein NUKP38_47750 [Klebsiella variicola]GKK71625.1 hypothetical protein NUKP41_23030 [Klebsiella variicola]VAU30626.1 Uncharacterised protein [Klebsiella variicola]
MKQFVLSDTFFVLDNLKPSKFRKNNFAMTSKEFKESGMNCKPAKLFCYKSMFYH